MPVLRLLVVLLLSSGSMRVIHAQDSVVHTEFVYQVAPFASAHASTLTETKNGLVAAWFGGTAEGNADVGIWLARHNGDTWSAPVEIANGVQSNGTRFPGWNPVLFQPTSGPLLLFYKVGPNPREWWGMVRISHDEGRTWSQAGRLPAGILGPIRAKPIELHDGTLLAGSSTEHDGWVAHMEHFRPHSDPRRMLDALTDPARWKRSAALNRTSEFGAIQPTLLAHTTSRIQVLCRSRQNVITEAWSNDAGTTWSKMTRTNLPNPSAGIDAVHLTDGRFLLVYNPTSKGRQRLAVSLSDDGSTWTQALLLEDAQIGEFSYPAVIQTEDDLIHITYTWQRQRIKYVVLDPRKL